MFWVAACLAVAGTIAILWLGIFFVGRRSWGRPQFAIGMGLTLLVGLLLGALCAQLIDASQGDRYPDLAWTVVLFAVVIPTAVVTIIFAELVVLGPWHNTPLYGVGSVVAASLGALILGGSSLLLIYVSWWLAA